AQVGQAREVFVGAADPVFGVATALLVFGNARRFFDEVTQVLRLGFDQLGDHALLDDRIAARAEAGAEEDVGDVATTALGAVQVIAVLAVAGHFAANGDFRVAGLDAGLTDRFTAGGAVENDIGHRLTTQVLGRAFAHDPAHRVDDVGFAASIGADHGRHVAGEVHRRRVDERLEPRQPDAFKAHGSAGRQGRQDRLTAALGVTGQHGANARQIAHHHRFEQLAEQGQVFAHLGLALFQCQIVEAAHGRLQVLDGLFKVRIIRERIRRAHHVEAVLDEAFHIFALTTGDQTLLYLQERRQIEFFLPA
nr:hypothetical protein [Tanacetum cinerariifolium]